MIEIVRTVKDIEKKDWNNLVGKDIVETSYEWVSFAEDIDVEPGHHCCHAVCKEKGNTVGILPAYYHNIYVRKPPKKSRFYPARKVFPRVKIPFKMTRIHIPLSCDSRYFGYRKYFYECLAEIENFSRERNHFLLRIDDFNEEINIPGFFVQKYIQRCIQSRTLPGMYILRAREENEEKTSGTNTKKVWTGGQKHIL